MSTDCPIHHIRKRDGRIVPFDRTKIENAVAKAARAVGNGVQAGWAANIAARVTELLVARYGPDSTPEVEQIQDVVEEVLIGAGHPAIAKAYILYREQRSQVRATEHILLDGAALMDDYLKKLDWRVSENSNMNYSLQGLNFYVASSISARYWLHRIYPPQVRQAHTEGAMHIHDLSVLAAYTYYGKEVVIARLAGQLRVCSLEQLYEDTPGEEVPLNEADGAYAKYPTGLFVLDKDGWTRAVRLVRKTKHRPMRFIKNRGGRSVIVTDNHPMITQNGEKEAQELGVEDRTFTVELARLLAEETLFSTHSIDLAAAIREHGPLDCAVYLDGRPLEETEVSQNPGQETGLLHTATSSIPRFLQLTGEFGYFVGFALAEGFLSYDAHRSQVIAITQREQAPLLRANRGLLDNGISGVLTRRSDARWELRVTNPFLRFLFERVFKIKPGSRHKTLPVGILSYNQDFVKGVIAGVLDGDGSLEGNGTQLLLRVAARTLLEQLAVVLELLGFVPRDRAVEGQGSRRAYRGREIVQNYPLYGLAFSKTDVELPAEKYQRAAVATQSWHNSERDAWHRLINNLPVEIPDDVIYDITTESGTLIVNGMWNHNCCGWDLQDLLMRGFGGVPAKVESRPPRHLRSALGQVVNFFYTLQGETAGAQAFSNFDTLLAPFIAYDELDYKGVKQAIQEFVYNINVPTRVGFQSLAWDELVVVRRNGRIEVVEIGQLVDEQFARNNHRVLHQGHDSYAIANADDIQTLAFDTEGRVGWAAVKAFVRHRVPDGTSFVRVRTSRGTARVSPAHSLFAFETLDERFNPRPIAACEVDVAHGNARLTPTNHFIAVRQAPNGGTRDTLDLVELIDAVPQVADRARVRVPDQSQAVQRLQQRVREQFGGLTPFYLEYGIKDKGCWQQWSKPERGTLPYRVWRALGDNEPGAEFSLRNSDLWYSRTLTGERLREFIRLLAWYITEGHNDITNGLYVSQARGGDQEEMMRVLGALGALGHVEERQGWSAQRNPTSAVLRMAGKGLLAVLIGYLAGTYSTNKIIPWFVYDLVSALQETFIATLFRGDASEFSEYFDYTTTSKKLSLGLSLLLAMNDYKFSVYETSYDRQGWSDQYILRVYKDKEAAERYAVGDLLARVCLRRETFTYEREYEYDLSVAVGLENFAGGSGLLCFHNTPFTNITMDLTPSPTLRDQAVIIGGELQDRTYGEFQREMDLLNRAFAEVMLEGDARSRVFTFPIPTYNITADFDWENDDLQPLWEMTAKYGIPYFANYVNSDMQPEDARSMCCRLRLDNRELRRRTGGLFAASPLTGSVGVVTLNMARIGYLSASEDEFFARLGNLMDTAQVSLEIKRKTLERLTEQGLYPYSRHYLAGIKARNGAYWDNHFSTIGLNGMNEACLNFLRVGIEHPDGKAFALKVLDFMLEKLRTYQEETGHLYNLEASPAEGAAYRLARADVERYPDIITAGTREAPYYTNCLSSDTEVLTREGWRTHDQLQIGDEVLTYNLVTKTLEYQRSRNVYVYGGEWEMVNIRSRTQDQLVTPNHMVLFESGARKGFEFLAPAAHLPRRNFMVRMGARWCIQEDNPAYSDDLLRLIAWIVTEGHFEVDNSAVRITQARKSRYWEEIKGLLDRAGISYSILGTGEGKHKESIFRIGAHDGKWIRGIIQRKILPQELLASLSERQLNLVLLELAKGDGVVRQGRPVRLYTASAELAGQYQEIAIKTNKRSVIGYGDGTYYVDIVNSRCKSWITDPPARVSYEGIVWCIEVPNHTFVARRNGRPFITGNSTHLPVSYTDDLWATLAHQDELQTRYTGGTVLHIFLGERLDDWRQARLLVRRIAENFRLPYYTLTPTFSICPIHGYIPGEHHYCPYEHSKEQLEQLGLTIAYESQPAQVPTVVG